MNKNSFDIPEESTEEKSRFNMSYATLVRIDALFKICHRAHLDGDEVSWQNALFCIEEELMPFIMEWEKDAEGNLTDWSQGDKDLYERLNELKKIINDETKKTQNKRRNSPVFGHDNYIPPTLYKALHDFGITLRLIMKKKRMLMAELDNDFDIL